MQRLHDAQDLRLAGQLVALTDHLRRTGAAKMMALACSADLSLPRLRALLALREEQWLPLHELALEVGLSNGATVRLVDGLLARGLVSRVEDPADRRVRRIGLTAAGRDAVEALTAARDDTAQRFAASLLPEEAAALSAALDPVLRRLDADGRR